MKREERRGGFFLFIFFFFVEFFVIFEHTNDKGGLGRRHGTKQTTRKKTTTKEHNHHRIEKRMKPNTWATPDFSYYLSRRDIEEKLRKLETDYASIVRVNYVKKSSSSSANENATSSYSVVIPVVTINADGKFDDESGAGREKTRLFYDFGEHGREIITVDTAFRFMELLVKAVKGEGDNDNIDAFSMQKATNDRDSFLESLKQTTFTIIPIENVNGRALVEDSKKFCERKNGRGVDVNRNFPVNFGVKEKDYDPNEEFPGPYAMSEPESKVLEKLFKDVKPHAWVNVHSGMEAIFTPYDHKNVEPEGEFPDLARNIAEQINQMHCGKRCVTGSGGKGVGYLAHGTVTDYAFDVMKVPAAFTWEIYGDTQAHYDDCFAMFNPVTREKHDEVVEAWAGAGLSLAHLMRAHPAVEERKDQRSGSSRAALSDAEEEKPVTKTTVSSGNNDDHYQSLRGAGQIRGDARLRGSKINRKGHARSQMFGARDQDIDAGKYLILVSIFTFLYFLARRQFRAVKRYRTTRRNRDKATV